MLKQSEMELKEKKVELKKAKASLHKPKEHKDMQTDATPECPTPEVFRKLTEDQECQTDVFRELPTPASNYSKQESRTTDDAPRSILKLGELETSPLRRGRVLEDDDMNLTIPESSKKVPDKNNDNESKKPMLFSTSTTSIRNRSPPSTTKSKYKTRLILKSSTSTTINTAASANSIAVPATVATDKSEAVFGFLEGFDRLHPLMERKEMDAKLAPILPAVNELADLAVQMFIIISETQPGKESDHNLIPIRRLKTILQSMRIMNHENQTEIDIIFNQFRAKFISLFGMSFSLILCIAKRFPQMSMQNMVMRLTDSVRQYIQSFESNNMLLLPADCQLSARDMEEIAKLLEYNRKPLQLLFEAYASYADKKKKLPGAGFDDHSELSVVEKNLTISPTPVKPVSFEQSNQHHSNLLKSNSGPSPDYYNTGMEGESCFHEEKYDEERPTTKAGERMANIQRISHIFPGRFKNDFLKTRFLYFTDLMNLAKDFQIFPSIYPKNVLIQLFSVATTDDISNSSSSTTTFTAFSPPKGGVSGRKALSYEKVIFLTSFLPFIA
jgi:hypothetical protein